MRQTHGVRGQLMRIKRMQTVSPYHIGHKRWCFKLKVIEGDGAQGDGLSMTVG